MNHTSKKQKKPLQSGHFKLLMFFNMVEIWYVRLLKLSWLVLNIDQTLLCSKPMSSYL